MFVSSTENRGLLRYDPMFGRVGINPWIISPDFFPPAISKVYGDFCDVLVTSGIIRHGRGNGIIYRI